MFYQKQNARAFNWDTCCHLALCLQLLPFHCIVNFVSATVIKNPRSCSWGRLYIERLFGQCQFVNRLFLTDRCRSLHSNHLAYLSSDPASAKFIVEFCAHLLYCLDRFSIHKVSTLIITILVNFYFLFFGARNPGKDLVWKSLPQKTVKRPLAIF